MAALPLYEPTARAADIPRVHTLPLPYPGYYLAPLEQAVGQWEQTQEKFARAESAVQAATILNGLKDYGQQLSEQMDQESDQTDRGRRWLGAVSDRMQAALAPMQEKRPLDYQHYLASMTEWAGGMAAHEEAKGFGIRSGNMDAAMEANLATSLRRIGTADDLAAAEERATAMAQIQGAWWLSPERRQARAQLFAAHADQEEVLKLGASDPKATMALLTKEVVGPDGKPTYERWTLDRSQRDALVRTLHAQVAQQDAELERNRRDFQSQYQAWLFASMDAGDLSRANAVLLAQQAGLTGPEVDHIRQAGDAIERREAKPENDESVNTMWSLRAQFPVDMPSTLAGVRQEEAKVYAVLTKAQQEVAAGRMLDKEFTVVQDHGRTLINSYNNHYEALIREGDAANNRQEARLRRRYATEAMGVIPQIPSMLGIDISQAPYLRDIYHTVVKELEGNAKNLVEPINVEVNQGIGPREDTVNRIPDARVRILGGIPQAVQDAVGQLKTIGVATPEELDAKRGTLTTDQYTRAYDLFRQLTYMRQFIPQPSAPAPGQQPAGPRSTRPLRRREQSAPAEIPTIEMPVGLAP